MSTNRDLLKLIPDIFCNVKTAWFFLPGPSADSTQLKIDRKVHNRSYLDWLIEGFSSPTETKVIFMHGKVDEDVKSLRSDTVTALFKNENHGERQIEGLNLNGKLLDMQTISLLGVPGENGGIFSLDSIIVADFSRFPDFSIACSSTIDSFETASVDVAFYDCGEEEAGVYYWASKAALCQSLSRCLAKCSRTSEDALEGPSLGAILSRACQDAKEEGKNVVSLPGGCRLLPLTSNSALLRFAHRHLRPLAFPALFQTPLPLARLIAHRGNMRGPDWGAENDPNTMAATLQKFPELQMEVDLWVIEPEYTLWLGHDGPEHKIMPEWLERYKTQLVVHGKNILAAHYAIEHDLECFGHDYDEYVMTSKGCIWRYPRADIPITSKTIVVMPEYELRKFTENDLHSSFKICTDYVLHLAGLEA
mmetsp:Transcript_5444/g.7355  ORF Transcript_5444/g.7355 Transcript_5444/m.7355 type:complete len:420 (+) Transcript_5444:61-1320(+)|eukprot:CAMPEP_0196599374 /NCGR_PEP_ID=MMETSP1081-20130531/94824_1 /TAXON_ID=36882 /ORGANISM="Pyramimonas amylifera, Strain CCMP720" /LENGTH=419 /DNA_ID=CAMNT_0041925141 /DNA_START=60 /DNA_END=1319 /DNA_ORIENTATION=-